MNGKKAPNRIGKDVFPLIVGVSTKKDISYGKYYHETPDHNSKGLCIAETDNIDPTKGSGANPTYYVMLHKQLPDYGKLSKTIPGFRP